MKKLHPTLADYVRVSDLHNQVREEFSAIQKQMNEEWRSVCWKEFIKKHVKHRRKKPDFALVESLDPVLYFAIRNPRETLANEITKKFRERLAVLEEQEKAAAEKAVITPSKTVWTLFTSRSSFDYHTQGFGAGAYARNAAEMQGDVARHNGFDVHLSQYFGEHGQSVFEVWIDGDALACEILRHKPGPDLVEAVRLCWKRKVNPRVYIPFLPHGFEEKHGLDYYGNQKTASIGTPAR